jgi:nucleoside-diphosphate-sugar epimerase
MTPMPPSAPLNWVELHGDRFAGARVLVTGGAGFIGSHLVRALLELSADVVVLDNLVGGSLDNLRETGPIKFVNGTLLDQPCVEQCMAGCKFIFHLAAMGSVPASIDKPRLFHEVNDTGTLNLLEAARRHGVQRVVFAASSSGYGDNPMPWIETMAARPRSPYAASKVAGEAMMRAYSGSYGLDTVSLRYFNIFGPRQNANSAYAAVIAAFTTGILAGRPPVIFGDGSQTRDFTYVDNAVHANLLAAGHRQPLGGEIVNVGCGTPITVNELAKAIANELGSPVKPVYQPARPGDLEHSFADLGKAKSLLNFMPIVPFEEGLRRTVAWYRALGKTSRPG